MRSRDTRSILLDALLLQAVRPGERPGVVDAARAPLAEVMAKGSDLSLKLRPPVSADRGGA